MRNLDFEDNASLDFEDNAQIRLLEHCETTNRLSDNHFQN